MICLATPSKLKSLVSCIVLKDMTQHEDEVLSTIRMTCLRQLPQSLVPSIWQLYDVPPTTVIGKTDLIALAIIAQDRAATCNGPENSDSRVTAQVTVV